MLQNKKINWVNHPDCYRRQVRADSFSQLRILYIIQGAVERQSARTESTVLQQTKSHSGLVLSTCINHKSANF